MVVGVVFSSNAVTLSPVARRVRTSTPAPHRRHADPCSEHDDSGLALRPCPTWWSLVELIMVEGRWSWIVPPGLWELAKPLLPPSGVRPQGGGTQNIADEAVFAAIVYVLVSGCAWRALPPCFGAARSTVHRRFTIWARAGVFARLHREILERMRESGLLDLSRVLLDSAHIRAKKGANTQVRAPWTGVNRVRRCTSCPTARECPSSRPSHVAIPTTPTA